MNRFLLWLTGYLPGREIRGFENEVYLERYFLFTLFGWTCYIHRFLASDPDRGLHDHPWGISASLVLSTGYLELRTKMRSRKLRPGMINIIRGTDFHRIIVGAVPAWTLFLHGPRTKSWGFKRGNTYSPFVYKGDGEYSYKNWWRTAPKGKVLRAQICARD